MEFYYIPFYYTPSIQTEPKILEGRHVIGIDETNSGKTTAFVLPILQRLAEHPFDESVFALVMAPSPHASLRVSWRTSSGALGPPFTSLLRWWWVVFVCR